MRVMLLALAPSLTSALTTRGIFLERGKKPLNIELFHDLPKEVQRRRALLHHDVVHAHDSDDSVCTLDSQVMYPLIHHAKQSVETHRIRFNSTHRAGHDRGYRRMKVLALGDHFSPEVLVRDNSANRAALVLDKKRSDFQFGHAFCCLLNGLGRVNDFRGPSDHVPHVHIEQVEHFPCACCTLSRAKFCVRSTSKVVGKALEIVFGKQRMAVEEFQKRLLREFQA